MAVGQVATKTVALGVELTVKEWTDEENAAFDRDWDSLIAQYTKFTINNQELHVIGDIYNKYKEIIRQFGQVCSYEIEPRPGKFIGMGQAGGSGMIMTKIRPDHIFPAGQGRTFDYSFSGLTANNWYGTIHNGAMPATLAAALFLRKFLGVCIIGCIDTGGNPAFDEFQWTDLDGKSLPINNAVEAFRGTDLAIYEFPSAMWLKPSKQYRLQGKVNVAAASGALIFMGVTFIKYENGIQQQPTVPTNTAP